MSWNIRYVSPIDNKMNGMNTVYWGAKYNQQKTGCHSGPVVAYTDMNHNANTHELQIISR